MAGSSIFWKRSRSHVQPLHAVEAPGEHVVGEVEEVEPDGQQEGAHHGGLQPRAREAQQGELHVRVLHLRGGGGQPGGGGELGVNPPPLPFAIVEVADEDAVARASDALVAGLEPGELAGDAAGGGGHLVHGPRNARWAARALRHADSTAPPAPPTATAEPVPVQPLRASGSGGRPLRARRPRAACSAGSSPGRGWRQRRAAGGQQGQGEQRPRPPRPRRVSAHGPPPGPRKQRPPGAARPVAG